MSEKKTILKVPDAYKMLLEDIRSLKSDEANPNKMTNKQKEQVWKSLQKHGWIYPIVTDLQGQELLKAKDSASSPDKAY